MSLIGAKELTRSSAQKPICTCHVAFPIGLPVFNMPLPPDTEVEYGKTLRLICAAMNAPKVPTDLTFIWMINDTNLTALNDSRVSVIEDLEVSNEAESTLVITSSVFSDKGNYTCLVHNRLPQDGVATSTELEVIGQFWTLHSSMHVTGFFAVALYVAMRGLSLLFQLFHQVLFVSQNTSWRSVLEMT